MNKSSTPHGFNGGGDTPTDKHSVVLIRAGMKDILMKALARLDQVRNSNDFLEFIDQINGEVEVLQEKFSVVTNSKKL